jgi:hypothetical protein
LVRVKGDKVINSTKANGIRHKDHKKYCKKSTELKYRNIIMVIAEQTKILIFSLKKLR